MGGRNAAGVADALQVADRIVGPGHNIALGVGDGGQPVERVWRNWAILTSLDENGGQS